MVAPDFLQGYGEVRALMRAHEWSQSPLGRPETWPQPLRSIVGVMLASKFPMYVAWGPELAYLYNDAYTSIIGSRHPGALGRPLREVWPEVWDTFGPLIGKALAGEATFHENLPILVERNGYEEQAYFTFSFSPIANEGGPSSGILAVVTETTSQVLNDQRLAFLVDLGDRLRGLTEPVEIITAAQEMLGQHLEASRVGYGDVDETGRYFTTERNWTDGSVAHHIGTHDLSGFGPDIHGALKRGETLVVHDVRKDPRTNAPEHQAAFAYLETASVATVSLIKRGRMVAALYVHDKSPRLWTQSEVRLIEDTAERTWDAVERSRAELALRASEGRLRLAIDAGRMAVWEHDTSTDTLAASPELNRILGYPVDATLDLADLRTRYYPGDRERLSAAAMAALQKGERFFEAEHRFYRLDGALRWFLMRAEMLIGPNGMPTKTVGVLLDITDRKQAIEALVEREAELRSALDAGSLAIFDFDHVKGRMNPSARLSELYGYPADHVLNIADIRARYHPDNVEQILNKRDRDQDDALIRHFDWTLRLLLPDNKVRWVNGRGEYMRDETGRIVRSRGVVMDITERKRWEEHQQLLINELNHRVKNTLATVQSIASQTLRNAGTKEDARDAIESRLFALSRAHDVLTRENWESASLREIISEAMAPYYHEREHRLHMEGPDLRLSPRIALAIAMALQELTTNAVKYGALSNATGEVRVLWRNVEAEGGRTGLNLTWTESGGPAVEVPRRRGFGTRLIERSLAHDLNGQVRIDFAPAGIVCTIDAPLS